MKEKTVLNMPAHHVMAFNAVSAPAYVGRAATLSIDGSLDDEPDIDAIIVCKDSASLRKVMALLGRRAVKEISEAAVVTETKYLRVMAPIRDGENGQINPNHRNQPEEDEL